jgi:hypothetical protein
VLARAHKPTIKPALAAAGEKDTDALVADSRGRSTLTSSEGQDALKKLEDTLKACAGFHAMQSGLAGQLLGDGPASCRAPG